MLSVGTSGSQATLGFGQEKDSGYSFSKNWLRISLRGPVNKGIQSKMESWEGIQKKNNKDKS